MAVNFAAVTYKKHSKNTANLQRQKKHLEKKIAEILEKVEQTDQKEEAAITELKKQEEKIKTRLKKTREAKVEIEKRKLQIKEKEHRDSHQINIEQPDARMMQSISTSDYNPQLSVDTATWIIVAQRVTVARSDNHEFSKQQEATGNNLGEDKTRKYVADTGYKCLETLEYIAEHQVDAFINASKEKEKQRGAEQLLKRGKVGVV